MAAESQARRENVIIYADPDRCMGCHSCEIACAVSHAEGHDLFSAVAARLPLQPRNHVVSVDGVTMPLQCRQCEDAPCTAVCPTGACRQTDGMVEIIGQHCIGCKLCAMVCPFGVITVKAEVAADGTALTNHGIAKKCDLCTDWRAETGAEETACVQSCPTKAIQLVDLDEYRKALREARARELVEATRHIRL
ncbi:4Fe-4S dicluster domain-containing protein [Sphingomonas abietis]|uniref:4Fe-4S dicluster domain-containing protein n=1 Tax=Sphingomonas abietis TaxID=3012344 RepID=A0ABY7NTC1_9SPHN|nr:4Fe-4S dicluster domain-containing protein [Sphingomonas abietis]WBO24392.1 4Fe-4S dicluster domain-containing protein [Sphingomonas abietis]